MDVGAGGGPDRSTVWSPAHPARGVVSVASLGVQATGAHASADRSDEEAIASWREEAWVQAKASGRAWGVDLVRGRSVTANAKENGTASPNRLRGPARCRAPIPQSRSRGDLGQPEHPHQRRDAAPDRESELAARHPTPGPTHRTPIPPKVSGPTSNTAWATSLSPASTPVPRVVAVWEVAIVRARHGFKNEFWTHIRASLGLTSRSSWVCAGVRAGPTSSPTMAAARRPSTSRSSSLALRALHVDLLLVDGEVGHDRGRASPASVGRGWGQNSLNTNPFRRGGAIAGSQVGPRFVLTTTRQFAKGARQVHQGAAGSSGVWPGHQGAAGSSGAPPGYHGCSRVAREAAGLPGGAAESPGAAGLPGAQPSHQTRGAAESLRARLDYHGIWPLVEYLPSP